MAVQDKDIILLAPAVAPEDDTTTAVGGAVATNQGYTGGFAKIEWEDLAATEQVKIVSENAGDTMNVTITYRTAGGAIDSEVLALNGITVATTTASMERLMKAELSADPAGHICLFGTTITHSGTADAGGADYIDLQATASDTDDAYNFHVIRLTGGTGSGQVREIVDYDGTLERAYVRDWGTNPDATTTYEIYAGMVFEEDVKVGICRRLFYDAAADAPGGSERTFKEKFFIKNIHATKDLTNAKMAEGTGGAVDDITFDIEETEDGTDATGANTRLDWTGGSYTFDSSQKSLGDSGDGILQAGNANGVWMELTLAAGAAAAKSFYPVSITGQST